MDLIERQAAIDAMKDTFKGTMVGTRVAVDAINRLPSAEPNLQPNLQPTCNQLATDCISRKEAIDAIDSLPNCYNGYSDSYDKSYIIGVLEELPSAEPRCIANIHLSQEQLDEAFAKVKADILSVKPKTGKWIGGELGECSVCGHKGCASDIWDRCKEYFCPNCGAKMEV